MANSVSEIKRFTIFQLRFRYTIQQMKPNHSEVLITLVDVCFECIFLNGTLCHDWHSSVIWPGRSIMKVAVERQDAFWYVKIPLARWPEITMLAYHGREHQFTARRCVVSLLFWINIRRALLIPQPNARQRHMNSYECVVSRRGNRNLWLTKGCGQLIYSWTLFGNHISNMLCFSILT